MAREGTGRLARYAFRIGYLAEGFLGYARQPRGETVEGTLRREILRRGLAPDEERMQLRSASRTDRGVHALGNVIAFNTPWSGPSVARALDAVDPRIFCFGYAPVPPTFQPRRARSRWYRYLLPREGHDPASWRAMATWFLGEHEFASFSRRDRGEGPTRRTVESFRVSVEGPWLLLDVRAPSFLWHQVRKMVGAMEEVAAGRIPGAKVQAALRGETRLTVPLADPSRLVLMEVLYDFRWREGSRSPRAHRRFLEEALAAARLRGTLLGWFQERVLASTSDP